MTSQFKEPISGNSFKSVDGWILPDTDGPEFRRTDVNVLEEIEQMGCNILYK